MSCIKFSIKVLQLNPINVGNRATVFNVIFNNISVIMWRSVLLAEKPDFLKITDLSLTNFITLCCIKQTSPSTLVIGTDCKGSCKSNYHTITTTMASINQCIAKFYFSYAIRSNSFQEWNSFVIKGPLSPDLFCIISVWLLLLYSTYNLS